MKIDDYSYIVADVGSNYTRVNLYQVKGYEENLVAEGVYNSQNFIGIAPILQIFLTENAISRPPDYGCFSFNGPVTKDTADMPLLGWHETAEEIETETGISKALLLNNYEAKGYGIEYLKDEDISDIAPGKKGVAGGSKIVIGADTGLGSAFIFYSKENTHVIAGEAGHSDFAARNKTEFKLAQFIKTKFDIQEVAVERVVSGIGLDTIYWYLVNETPDAANPELSEKIKQDDATPGRIVMSHALSKKDALCEKSLKIFVSAFGSIVGNMALSVLPVGGVYIAGGMAAFLTTELRADFLDNFYDKGRMHQLLVDFPLILLLNNHSAMLGTRHVARKLHATRFNDMTPVRIGSRQKLPSNSLAAGRNEAADRTINDAKPAMGLCRGRPPVGRRSAWVATGVALSAALIGAFAWGAASEKDKGDH